MFINTFLLQYWAELTGWTLVLHKMPSVGQEYCDKTGLWLHIRESTGSGYNPTPTNSTVTPAAWKKTCTPLILTCLPLCVTEERMVRRVLNPMAMSSR